MLSKRFKLSCLVSLICLLPFTTPAMEPTPEGVSAFLDTYCLQCHGGEKVKGKVDFSIVSVDAAADDDLDLWDLAAKIVHYGDMPPEDEKQPAAEERAAFQQWYEINYVQVEASPGVFKPRRLSTPEYRNTMHSLFGFDLANKVVVAEQTAIEPSLILKLMPTDPPGGSWLHQRHPRRTALDRAVGSIQLLCRNGPTATLHSLP